MTGGGPSHARVSRADWCTAALQALVSGGVEQVKILTLASSLGVARSSFYWHFANREELLDELLARWRDKNTVAVVERSAMPAATIQEAMLGLFEVWMDTDLFDPRLDFAIRDWARRDEAVRIELTKADATRIEAIASMFTRHGYDDREAQIRARVVYFTQVGYYDLVAAETYLTRMENAALYVTAFTGAPPSRDAMAEFRHRTIHLSDTLEATEPA